MTEALSPASILARLTQGFLRAVDLHRASKIVSLASLKLLDYPV